ncbi:hypothetical protein Godav_007830 [Gossypium davidsonii]|uniref:RNase H type-1 domain-containing protein n=2 Tax=Gossypium TaxID=3633 RepID=A0A7J8S9R0_GOSDV|nr:hypothetical protein [Gossypium davidsonii]MBA0657768.1 hypothetical protein [Gossypium klotzschianum]
MGSGVVVNNHAADAFLAEALACLQALDFSIEMGFREHTNRESNAIAHKLAQIGFNFESPQFWVENVPGEATDLVERD